MHKEILLEDIGEKELINRLGKFMPKNQISDDCALIKIKNENLKWVKQIVEILKSKTRFMKKSKSKISLMEKNLI